MGIGMKVLIVDDNSNMRAMIRKILEQNVPEIRAVIECDDGAEAIELYHQNSPDWVLMDIQLKEMDGLVATASILSADPTAKIVIVTQYDDSKYRKFSKNAGAYGYVLKDNLFDILKIIQSNNTNSYS